MTDVEFLKKAYNRLDDVLAQEWSKRAADAPYTDPYQALIMASLVEKETGVPEERGQIAGVFVRRLKVGMLLQTDPTVVKEGDILANLDPTDQQNQLRAAQGDLAKVQAQLINAQANARRQQELFDRGVGAQAKLDTAQADLKTTAASAHPAPVPTGGAIQPAPEPSAHRG